MPTRVLLTVDTELNWAPHARGASWQENLALSYDPAGVGVPWQLEVLGRHNLKACFFVDPMPALLYGLEPVRRMVEPILAAGQEVQLHLHPAWDGAARAEAAPRFNLTAFDEADQRRLIGTARDLLIEAGAPAPVAFRSGSYAADERTLAALRALGIRYDSSHNGSHHPKPSNLPLDAVCISPVDIDGVVEVPVTQIEDAPGRLRHLQLCAVSSTELGQALEHGLAAGHSAITIVSHSFELAVRGGHRPNRTLCRRFERLCGSLASRREDLPTAFFSELADLPLGLDARPLTPSRTRTARRMAEQLWSNAVYERVFAA
jgi:hypothetical protein